MIRNISLLSCAAILLFCSCKKTPSDKDIAKKVLMDYVCPETAKVNSLKVLKTSSTTSIFGLKGYQFVVSGEIEWPEGCNEFGTGLPAGYKEKFDNKSVVLIKSEAGWQ